jgi:phosphate uptake regulator
MNIQAQHESLRSQLFSMARLSQRAVDYSLKGYGLGRPEFCREVQSAEQELHNLRSSITDRGRAFLASGMQISADSRFACCALRICNALHNTYAAAASIALETMFSLEGGWRAESSKIVEMGQFVNSLVRLCTVALFNEDLRYARTVLQNDRGGRWFNLSLRQTQSDLAQQSGAHAKIELAIVENLGQIAEHSNEIANAITIWLEGQDCPNSTRERAPLFIRGSIDIQTAERAGAA